jgi:hypothetical protein
VAEVPPLNALVREQAGDDVRIFYVYTRETHPGENVPPHASFAEKVQRAREFRAVEHLEVPLLVDTFDGQVHRAYGQGPNMACIVHRDGTLVYRSEWTSVDDLAREIEHLRAWDAWEATGGRLRRSRIESVHAWFEDATTYEVRKRTYARAGELAVEDFTRKMGRSPI